MTYTRCETYLHGLECGNWLKWRCLFVVVAPFVTGKGLCCSCSCDTADVTGACFPIACDAVTIWRLVGGGGNWRGGWEMGKGRLWG